MKKKKFKKQKSMSEKLFNSEKEFLEPKPLRLRHFPFVCLTSKRIYKGKYYVTY